MSKSAIPVTSVRFGNRKVSYLIGFGAGYLAAFVTYGIFRRISK